MKSHIEEWKEIKDRYENQLKNNTIPKEHLKYRIERIEHLISSEEKNQDEFNHFK